MSHQIVFECKHSAYTELALVRKGMRGHCTTCGARRKIVSVNRSTVEIPAWATEAGIAKLHEEHE